MLFNFVKFKKLNKFKCACVYRINFLQFDSRGGSMNSVYDGSMNKFRLQFQNVFAI